MEVKMEFNSLRSWKLKGKLSLLCRLEVKHFVLDNTLEA